MAFVLFGIIGSAGSASAQTMQWTDKGFVSVNGGAQIGSHKLEITSAFDLYDETATVSTSQKVKGGGFFDIGGAYRVWGKNVLGGLTFSHTSSDTNASLNASIPDVIARDRPRTVTGSLSGVKHSENVIHLDAIWMMPVANKLDVGLFAGPSIFIVSQDIARTATVTEPAPRVDAPLTSVDKTAGGINFGADLQYLVHKQWAVGAIARYSWASVSFPGASKKLTVGGLQIGAGARMRF